jgi:hypothetical protein
MRKRCTYFDRERGYSKLIAILCKVQQTFEA